MSTSTSTVERASWTCPNCHTETRAPRKRCTECRTSRY
jgi:hypothetical protein